MTDVAKRLRVSIGVGVAVAVFFSLVAGAVHLASGGALLEKLALPFWHLPVLYSIAGILGGSVCGLLWPMRQSRWGAMTIGFFAVLPLYAGCAGMLLPRSEWIPVGIVIGAVCSALIGVPTAYFAWQDEYGR